MEEIYADKISVGGALTIMWAGLVLVSGKEVVSTSAGSIGSVCEARNFMGDEAERDLTKHLLINHMWDKYGEE